MQRDATAAAESKVNPILLDVPETIVTERMELRPPRIGAGGFTNEAIVESQRELAPYMPWANPVPTVAQTEEWCRRSLAKFVLREELHYQGFLKGTGTFVCNLGLIDVRWPENRAEIGYWLRTSLTGHGYMTEAAQALCGMAFAKLKLRRLQLRCDPRNVRSARVADRLGFELEGVLRQVGLDGYGKPCDLLLYSRIRPEG